MVQLSRLIGRPVLSARTGRRLGRVGEVLLDLAGRRVAGFRLRHGGLLDRRWRFAAMRDLAALGPDAVVVPDELALREDESRDDWPALGRHALGRRGVAVVDRDGAPLGRLVDAEAKLPAGDLVAIDVRQMGPTLWRRAPTRTIPVSRVHARGRGAIVVDAAPGGELVRPAASSR